MASLGKSSPLLRETGDAPVFAEDEDTQAARQLFEDVRKTMRVESQDKPCDPSGMSAAFKVIAGDGPEAIAEQARNFDLVVTSQPKNDPDHRLRETLRAVLFDS